MALISSSISGRANATTLHHRGGWEVRSQDFTPRFVDVVVVMQIRGEDVQSDDIVHRSAGWIGFLDDLFYGRSYIAAPAKLSIPVLLNEKSVVVSVCLAGKQSGGKRKVSYGDAR